MSSMGFKIEEKGERPAGFVRFGERHSEALYGRVYDLVATFEDQAGGLLVVELGRLGPLHMLGVEPFVVDWNEIRKRETFPEPPPPVPPAVTLAGFPTLSGFLAQAVDHIEKAVEELDNLDGRRDTPRAFDPMRAHLAAALKLLGKYP